MNRRKMPPALAAALLCLLCLLAAALWMERDRPPPADPPREAGTPAPGEPQDPEGRPAPGPGGLPEEQDPLFSGGGDGFLWKVEEKGDALRALVSTDGGLRWTGGGDAAVLCGERPLSAGFVDAAHGFLCFPHTAAQPHGPIGETRDGGVSWALLPDPAPALLAGYWTEAAAPFGQTVEMLFGNELGPVGLYTALPAEGFGPLFPGGLTVTADTAVLFDGLCAARPEAALPAACLEARPVEYRALLQRGSETLLYCFDQFLSGGQTGLRGAVLAATARAQMGAEDAGRDDDGTGQDWFDRFRARARELAALPAARLRAEQPCAWMLLERMDGDGLRGYVYRDWPSAVAFRCPEGWTYGELREDWRGAPEKVSDDGFRLTAPDGSFFLFMRCYSAPDLPAGAETALLTDGDGLPVVRVDARPVDGPLCYYLRDNTYALQCSWPPETDPAEAQAALEALLADLTVHG